MTELRAINISFTTITITWQPPPGMNIMYQVTYSINGTKNTYNTTTPPVTITSLVPRTIYTFSVVGYTIAGPGTPQQVQTSTAAMRECTAVTVSYICSHIHLHVVPFSQCDWSGGSSHQHNICQSVLAGCPVAPSRWHPYRVHSVLSFWHFKEAVGWVHQSDLPTNHHIWGHHQPPY